MVKLVSTLPKGEDREPYNDPTEKLMGSPRGPQKLAARFTIVSRTSKVFPECLVSIHGRDWTPNVEVIRGYGWRGSCPAGDVPDERVGFDD